MLDDTSMDENFCDEVVSPILKKIKKEFSSSFLTNLFRPMLAQAVEEPERYLKNFEKYCSLFKDFVTPENGDAAYIWQSVLNHKNDPFLAKPKSRSYSSRKRISVDEFFASILKEVDSVFSEENHPLPISFTDSEYHFLWKYLLGHSGDFPLESNLIKRLAQTYNYDYNSLKNNSLKRDDLLQKVLQDDMGMPGIVFRENEGKKLPSSK